MIKIKKIKDAILDKIESKKIKAKIIYFIYETKKNEKKKRASD